MFNPNLFIKIINAISSSISVLGCLLKAIFEFILKAKGRSWKTICAEILENKTEETKELLKVVKEEAHVIADIAKEFVHASSSHTNSSSDDKQQPSNSDKDSSSS